MTGPTRPAATGEPQTEDAAWGEYMDQSGLPGHTLALVHGTFTAGFRAGRLLARRAPGPEQRPVHDAEASWANWSRITSRPYDLDKGAFIDGYNRGRADSRPEPCGFTDANGGPCVRVKGHPGPGHQDEHFGDCCSADSRPEQPAPLDPWTGHDTEGDPAVDGVSHDPRRCRRCRADLILSEPPPVDRFRAVRTEEPPE